MARNEPPFPPLVVVLLGLLISSLAPAVLVIDADGTLTMPLVALSTGLGGTMTLIGVVAAGVELGMKRATFRR